jgi:hypothetical protein
MRPLRPRMTAGTSALLYWSPPVAVAGARGRTCPVQTSPRTQLVPNRRSDTPAATTPRPATTPTGTPTWARIRHERRCKVNTTIFEHIHSRQFCVTDAHLP